MSGMGESTKNMEDQVEVVVDRTGAPRVQLAYEAWTQLREYRRALANPQGSETTDSRSQGQRPRRPNQRIRQGTKGRLKG